MRVFLGGTCNGSTWRDELIPKLNIDYFNPVVEDWTPECQAEEVRQRQECDFVLYTITKEMKGVYSIAEAIDDSNKRPEKTVLCLVLNGFDEAQTKSLIAVSQMAHDNGAHVCFNLTDAAEYLNTREIAVSAV